MTKRHLLITGLPGTGKTTLLVRLARSLAEFRPAGFYTEEIRERGERLGFRLMSLDGRKGILAHVEFRGKERVGRYCVDVKGFEAFLAQLRHLKANGVEFIVRGNHGMTHSAYIADPDGYGLEVLYEVPEEVWIGDVNGALNFFEPLPADQELEDTTDYRRFEAPQSTTS